jgi:hypothetical protein
MKVPVEFLGQARLFRRAVVAADERINAALPAITAPLERRLAAHRTLRREQVPDVLRAWRTRISDELTLDRVERPYRDGVIVGELRPVGSRWLTERWADAAWQPGVTLTWLVLSTADRRVRVRTRPAVQLLQHALARRFERGDGRTVPLVVRDLRALAAAAPTDAGEIPAGNGRWRVERYPVRCEGEDRPVPMVHCKTFVVD